MSFIYNNVPYRLCFSFRSLTHPFELRVFSSIGFVSLYVWPPNKFKLHGAILNVSAKTANIFQIIVNTTYYKIH